MVVLNSMDKTLKNQPTLLLASASPRRKQLLSELGFPVKFLEVRKVDETYDRCMKPEDVPLYLSYKKAEAYKDCPLKEDEIIVTADTVVILDDKVLGKPASEEDAAAMLRTLSGRKHKVVSGVTLMNNAGEKMSFSTETTVDFYNMTDDEIEFYVRNFHPLDKAGAYGIQEWIGYIGVSGINGDYYNVMGLPLHNLYRHIKDFICRTKE